MVLHIIFSLTGNVISLHVILIDLKRTIFYRGLIRRYEAQEVMLVLT